MALVLKDRVKETSTTAGTGTLTLAGAVSGFQAFSAVGNGNTTYYAIVDAATGDWEVGLGTYTSSGTTLSRDTVLSSSNSGSLVPFAGNSKDVFVTYPSEKSVYLNASDVVAQQSFGAITATSAALTTGTVSTTPVLNADIANKEYVDSVAADGVHYHEAVFVESPNTAGNLTAAYTSGGTNSNIIQIANGTDITFFGYTPVIGDQFLTTAGNGLLANTPYYIVALVGSACQISLTYGGAIVTGLTNGGVTLPSLINPGVGAYLTNAGTKAALTIDGELLTVGKRVLIYNQTNGFENGVYTVTTVGTPDPGGTNWVLTRATDADTYSPSSSLALGQGDAFYVTNGDTGAGESYVVSTNGNIFFGITAINFAQISSAQIYSAGTGLNLSPATTFNISNTGVTAATYGSASSVPVIAVNAQGQITSATDTAIAINGSAVTGAITGQAGSVANALTAGTYLTSAGTYDGAAARTFAVDATSANTASKVVARDSNGDFSAGTITATLSGSATSSGTATNVAGGAANKIPYQTGASTTSFIDAPTTSSTSLTWDGSAFTWAASGTATNLAGGAASQIPYQTGVGTTAFIANGTAGQVLTSNGTSVPSWESASVASATYVRTSFTATAAQTTFTVAYTVGYAEVFLNGVLLNSTDYTASNGTTIVLAVAAALNDIVEVIAYNVTSLSTATAATNIAGGAAGQLPYQTGPGATAFTAAGTAGQLLQSNGSSAPTWVAAPSTSAAGSTGQLQYNNAGAFAAVSSGTSGQVLTSAGAGSPPTWATASSPGPYKNDITNYDASVTFSSAIQTNGLSNAFYGLVSVQLTSTTELLFIWGGASCHAVVWDNTAKAFGTPALVRTAAFTSVQDLAAIAISSTSVLVNTLPGGGTALQTVVLSISGTTITVNSPISTTLAGNGYFINTENRGNGANRCQACGSSYVLSYYRTNPAFRAITVSGTVPTVGSELLLTGVTSASNTSMNTFVYSSSVVVHVSASTTLVRAVPVSVSGSTLTLGTQATTTCISDTSFNSGQFLSGRIGIAYMFTGSLVYGAVVSVAGTTASISVVNMSFDGSTNGDPLCMQIIGNRAWIGSLGIYLGNVYNALTDNAGTAVAGTAQPQNLPGGYAYSYILGTNGTNIYVVGSNNPSSYSFSGNNIVLNQQYPGVIGSSNDLAVPLGGISNSIYSYSRNYANLEYSQTIRGASNRHVYMSSASGPFAFATCFDGTTVTVQNYQIYRQALDQRSALGLDGYWFAAKNYPSTTIFFRRMEIA